MNQTEYNTILQIITDKDNAFSVRPRLKEYLKTVQVVEEPVEKEEPKWTDNQRKAFHKGCEEMADYLNGIGKDMKAILKHDVDIPWTKDSVKEFIFRPIMKAMYGYESHNQLQKREEVTALWNVAMKHLGEKAGVEYMEFPSDKNKPTTMQNIEDAKKIDYPEYDSPPTI